MLTARSAWECVVYVGQAASACGQRGFELDEHTVREVDGREIWEYQGHCDACGEQRRFEFAAPSQPAPPYPEFGGAEPSQLLAAADFVAIGERAAAAVPADPDGLSAAEVADGQEAIAIAVAAIEEALKFGRAGAASDGGLDRAELEALLAAYREVQAAYAAVF